MWYELQAREWPFKNQPAEALIWQIGSGEGVKQVLATVSLGKEVNVSTSGAGVLPNSCSLGMLEKRELLKGIYFTLIITLKIKGRRENRLEWDRLDSKSLPIIVIQKWASAGTQDTVWLLECPKCLLKSSCSWAPTNHTAQSVAWSEQLTWELSGDNEPEMSFAGNSLSMLVIWSQWET